MLYKKYIIEILLSKKVISDIIQDNGNNYNTLNLSLRKIDEFVNVYNYLDNYGLVNTFPYKFYTHEQADYYLNKYYYNILNVTNVHYPPIVKITEVYDNIQPPLLILRKLKINKILKKIKKHVQKRNKKKVVGRFK